MSNESNVLLSTGTSVAANSPYATASFVTAVLTLLAIPAGALFQPLVYAHLLFPIAIISGHVARRKIRQAPARFKGESMATFGMWVGYFDLLITLLVLYATFA